MGMCAIYTAIRPPTPEELITLARENETQKYVAHRRTLGRRAVAELVATCAPRSHAAFARAILERDLWGFLTPAAARGNHATTLQRVHEDIVVPTPVWPASTELACLVGAPPAQYLGNNLVLLSRELVDTASATFARWEATSEPAAYLNEFLRDVQARKQALLLHWDYR